MLTLATMDSLHRHNLLYNIIVIFNYASFQSGLSKWQV
jgi:hypothetical protein